MEIKCQSYHDNLNRPCRDIFADNLSEILDELSQVARFYMSSDVDAGTMVKINSAILQLLKFGKYRFLPVHMVGEAFTRGSMGELGGTTRFTVRNVCIWLSEVLDKQQRISAQKVSEEDEEKKKQEERKFRENKSRNNLYGSAMFRKIEWCHAGLLSPRQYDECTLDKIVDLIERGYPVSHITPSMIIK